MVNFFGMFAPMEIGYGPNFRASKKSHRNQTGAFAYMALSRPPTTLEYGLG
jgi:hypothetical protein